MLIDLVDKFQKAVDENENIILDNYKLKEGIYIKLDFNKSIEENINNIEEQFFIQSKKGDTVIEKKSLYDWFKIRDYCSSVLNNDSNKMVDLPGRKIHSTNYLTIFIKEGTIFGNKKAFKTIEDFSNHISKFYDLLHRADEKIFDIYPISGRKRKEKEQKRLEFFKKFYPKLIDILLDEERQKKIKKCKDFYMTNLNEIINILTELQEKYKFNNYIKLFLDAPEDEYRREYDLYIIPKIFTVNKFNHVYDGDIVGLPPMDLTANEKKPFLLHKTMKTEVPLRLPLKQAIARKDFYNWLEVGGKFKTRRITTNDFLVSLKKNKSANYHVQIDGNSSINYYDLVPFRPKEKFYVEVKNILLVREYSFGKRIPKADYDINDWEVLRKLISKYFFKGFLNGNLLTLDPDVKANVFTKKMQTYLLKSKEAFYDLFYKGTDLSIKPMINNLTLNLIVEQLLNTTKGTDTVFLAEAYNLRLALLKYFEIEGGVKLAETISDTHTKIESKLSQKKLVLCENDQEYYFLVGQMSSYLLSLSASKDKNYGMFEPVLRVKHGNHLKDKVEMLINTYGHAVRTNLVFSNACAMIFGYETNSKIEGENRDFLLAGLFADNVFWKKQEDNKKIEGAEKSE